MKNKNNIERTAALGLTRRDGFKMIGGAIAGITTLATATPGIA